ncbi:MAG TPA: sugar ABC transporter permease [Solirubrobacterales bacterium]|nr:sugar ABC transporter permease [Solirubrobacterales bacterium]
MSDALVPTAPAEARPPARPSGRRRGTPRASERRTAWAMVAPTILVVLAVALLPIADTVWLSLHQASVTETGAFVGLDNFKFIFSDPAFTEALKNTAIFTVVSVAIELVLGLGIALVLNQHFRGRGAIRAIVLIPWAFPLSVAAVLGRLMLQDQVGILSYIAHGLGLAHGPILSDPNSLLVSVILVDVWTSVPFMALLLLAGLQTIPGEVIEAARVDGASAAQRLFRITLPLLWPAILLALLFRTLQAWAVYDLFYVMAQRQLESLSTYVYQGVRVSELNFAPGTAAAVFTFLTSLAIVVLFIRGFGARTAGEV